MLLPLGTGFSNTHSACRQPFFLSRSLAWLQRFLLLLHLFGGKFSAVSISGITSPSLSRLARFFHMILSERFLAFESMNFCTASRPWRSPARCTLLLQASGSPAARASSS